MLSNLPLFPEQASTLAGRVDALFVFLVCVSVFFAGIIFLLVLSFAIRYRRRSPTEQPRPILGDLRLEVLWTVIPLGLTMVMFVWGASLYFTTATPPGNAMEIHVVGKQWMWYQGATLAPGFRPPDPEATTCFAQNTAAQPMPAWAAVSWS